MDWQKKCMSEKNQGLGHRVFRTQGRKEGERWNVIVKNNVIADTLLSYY